MFAVHETRVPILIGTSAQVWVGLLGHDCAHSVAESYLFDL